MKASLDDCLLFTPKLWKISFILLLHNLIALIDRKCLNEIQIMTHNLVQV